MQKEPKSDDIRVGQNLRQLRILRGVTQEQLGKALEITFQQVQKYEKGTNRVSASRMAAICRVLNCTVNDIMRGTAAEDTQVSGAQIPFPVISAQAMKFALQYDRMSTKSKRAVSALVSAIVKSDEDIDTSDIPEATEEFFQKAKLVKPQDRKLRETVTA